MRDRIHLTLSVSDGAVLLNFDLGENDEDRTFRIYRAEDMYSTDNLELIAEVHGENHYDDADVEPGKTYRYQVEADGVRSSEVHVIT